MQVCVPAYMHVCTCVCLCCVFSHDLAPQVLLKCVMLNKRQAGPSGDQRHNCKHRPISCWFCHFLFTISSRSHFTWIIATASDIYHKLKYDHTRPHNWGPPALGAEADLSKHKAGTTAPQLSLLCGRPLIAFTHIVDIIDCFCFRWTELFIGIQSWIQMWLLFITTFKNRLFRKTLLQAFGGVCGWCVCKCMHLCKTNLYVALCSCISSGGIEFLSPQN